MEEVFGGIIDKAFSIAVAAFLLLRMERELKLLRASIDRLRHCAVCTISPVRGSGGQGNPLSINLNDNEETKKLWRAYADEEGVSGG